MSVRGGPGREFAIGIRYSRRAPLIPVALLVAAAALSQAAAAATLHGRVVGVADGDTVTILVSGRTRQVVRLAGIDAPEKAQPYGDRAKRHLSDLVFGAEVAVEYEKRDRYGRIVGKIIRDGRDASLAQVESGYAWHYKRYASEQSPRDRTVYANAEDAARRAGRGLWAEKSPVPPWEWRAQRRAGHPVAGATAPPRPADRPPRPKGAS